MAEKFLSRPVVKKNGRKRWFRIGAYVAISKKILTSEIKRKQIWKGEESRGVECSEGVNKGDRGMAHLCLILWYSPHATGRYHVRVTVLTDSPSYIDIP